MFTLKLQNNGGDDIQIFAPGPKTADSETSETSENNRPSDLPAPNNLPTPDDLDVPTEPIGFTAPSEQTAPSELSAPNDPTDQTAPGVEPPDMMDEEFLAASDEMMGELQGKDEAFQPGMELLTEAPGSADIVQVWKNISMNISMIIIEKLTGVGRDNIIFINE